MSNFGGKTSLDRQKRASSERVPGRRRTHVATAASCIYFYFIVMVLPLPVASLEESADGFCEGKNAQMSCCKDGSGSLMLPVFPHEDTWNKNFRAFLYIVGLLWCFVGVSVLSDVFMAGIEAITNSTYRRKTPRNDQSGNQMRDKDGNLEWDYEDTLIWNPAVANLTLMALGSSTPEILLSIIEIAGANFISGDLGPGTVVGSAAFNLYVITAMCMVALPPGEGRQIDNLTTFSITGFHSLFAYLWLAISLLVISPDVVEIWEAVVTLGCMPWLTFWVWCADNNWFRKDDKVHPEDEQQAVKTTEGAGEIGNGNGTEAAGGREDGAPDEEGSRRLSVRRQLSSRDQNRSFLKNRHAALSSFVGGKKAVAEEDDEEAVRAARRAAEEEKDQPVFQFEAGHYAFLETVGQALVKVVRAGKMDVSASVQLTTVEGTAKAGDAFEAKTEVLEFAANEREKGVFITIIHDKIWNDDLKFSLLLSLPNPDVGKLGMMKNADVTIIDMDGPGVFCWMDAGPQHFLSSDSRAFLVVERRRGCTGPGWLRVRTVDGTAKAGVHYEMVDEEMEWSDCEAAKSLPIKLIQFKKPGEMEPPTLHFFVDLEPSSQSGKATAEIGEKKRAQVHVKWNEAEKIGEGLEEASWADQFRQALSVGGGEDVEEASVIELLMHYISITWKLLAAFVPPPHYLGGWACFWVALALIGVVTMFINDMASIFGCLVGLRDQVTAITIVALGTSLPDTFASVLAIRSDDNADNAVGNVTGSNSINVFLGLGLPWTMAAFYWGSVGPTDKWLSKYAEWELLPKYRESGAFVVLGGSLGFNTTIFTILSILTFSLLFFRRYTVGYEIGGPKPSAIASSCVLCSFWIIYILVSSLNVYHPDQVGW
eukprot:CAMPEP_0181299782 /NCGR_PEP_ID=MMETSP1101-20121128/6535_1 /TAXON_ID=46948 /ORGANISM="Rhodomonas abbreviata, Strain Caron Lab Isolate" /LENGTH=878 /DNA_ID=CAMNT_0023404965 /DNA_START=315 /DNA_END=2948 /DNA_ORIENTATION=+